MDAALLRLISGAKTHAKRWGYPEEADDFSQYVAEHYLLERKATLSQLWIDYLRVQFGRSKRGSVKRHEPLAREPQAEKITELIELPVMRSLSERERIVLILYAYFGCTKREIAAVFGIWESQVGVILKGIRQKSIAV